MTLLSALGACMLAVLCEAYFKEEWMSGHRIYTSLNYIKLFLFRLSLNYHRLCGLINKHLFLTVLESRYLRSELRHGQVLEKTLVQASRSNLFCLHLAKRKTEATPKAVPKRPIVTFVRAPCAHPSQHPDSMMLN